VSGKTVPQQGAGVFEPGHRQDAYPAYKRSTKMLVPFVF
jgi:hypothetical protein